MAVKIKIGSSLAMYLYNSTAVGVYSKKSSAKTLSCYFPPKETKLTLWLKGYVNTFIFCYN